MNSLTNKFVQAVIELFKVEYYKYLSGDHIHKKMVDVLFRDDLKLYLLNSGRVQFTALFLRQGVSPNHRLLRIAAGAVCDF